MDKLLPDDIIKEISTYFNDNEHWVTRKVCKRFHELLDGRKIIICKIMKSEQYICWLIDEGYFRRRVCWFIIVNNYKYELLEYAIERGCVIDDLTFNLAVSKNRIDILNLLHQHNCPINDYSFSFLRSIEPTNFRLFTYLISINACREFFIIEHSIQIGNLDLFKWIFESYISFCKFDLHSIWKSIIVYGRVNFIDWLYNTKYIRSLLFSYYTGHVGMKLWLKEHGY